ncbi:MAG TPA: YdcF family protein [Gemmatimonadales bacterium]|nr:YdcF family protein [Gemmatimonadales bacterium]
MPFWTLRRRLATAGALAVVLAFVWAAVVLAVALAAARDEATTADAIAVLGAAQYNGHPSPVFRARLDHAAALYQRGLAPVVLVTGGVGTGDTVSESEVGRRYLIKAGLPESAVAALPAGTSTWASVDGVARWFAGRDSRRVLLVSDGFHMLRLQILATRRGLVPFTSPAPNSPIRANPRLNAAYFLVEGVKVPVTWVFNR